MSDTEFGENDVKEQSGQTVVLVPAEHTRAVLDFLSALDREEADVSGYLSSLESVEGRTAKLTTYSTVSGLRMYTTGVFTVDLSSSDTDTEII